MKTFTMRFLLPPAYATAAFTILAFTKADGWTDLLGFALGVLWFAYLFASVPSLIFAYTMRRIQRRGFRHGGIRLLTAALLGLGAGFVLGLFFNTLEPLGMFLPIGLFVGLLVELTVVLTENRHPTRP